MTYIIKQNTFESGNPSGTAMTAGSGGNTGGGAGDWLANVFAGTGAATLFVSDPWRGSLGGLARLVAASTATFGFRTTALGHADIWVRGYFKISALPPNNIFLCTVRDNALSASGFSIRMSTTGVLSVYKRSATAATLASYGTACAINTWYRIDAHFTASGDWEMRVFPASTPWTQLDAAISGTGVSTALTFFDYDNVGAEMSTGTATLDVTWDDIAYGSAVIGPPPGADARPIQNNASVNMTPVGKPSHREATSDGSDSTYVESGALSATASYTENRLSELGSGSVKFRSRIAADVGTGVDAEIRLMQGASLVATRTVTDVPVTITTYEYTCTAPEEALITDRSDLRVRTAFTA